MASRKTHVLNRRTPCCNAGVKNVKPGDHDVECPKCDKRYVLTIEPVHPSIQARLGERATYTCKWRRVERAA